MQLKEILNYLVDEIHTTVVATLDEKGLPVTSVIDMMLTDNDKLYFITAKGKTFYKRVSKRKYIALSGIKGEDTLSSVSVTLKGYVRDIGSTLLDRVFLENDYMNDIYPTQISRKALTVFELYKGSGEYFDLSSKPIERYSFTFGDMKVVKDSGYFINNQCSSCGLCQLVCPQDCIMASKPFVISQKNCLHCGNCFDVCSYNAVEKN